MFWSEAEKKQDDENAKNNARDRDIRKLLRARKMLKRMGFPAILVVEEADGILATLVSEEGSAVTRALRNQVLDHSPVITFLISNHPEKFDAAANRRVIRYTVPVPPADKRAKMVQNMGTIFGLEIERRDATALGKLYVFTPGIIKSALQYMADIVSGQRIHGTDRSSKVSAEELDTAFRRKAVTMAGTSVKLTERIEPPEQLDSTLYFTDDLNQQELERLVHNKSPKLWLLAGRPETEITNLALYAASRSGDCEIIQIGAVNSNILEQLEAAKRSGTPVVMTGFDNFLNNFRADDLRTHPLLIAAQDHVNNGHSVFLISDRVQQRISAPMRSLFGTIRRGYAGFKLATGYDLVHVINSITGLEISAATKAFFEQTGNSLVNDPVIPNLFNEDNIPDLPGIIIAGPGNVRSAYQTLLEEDQKENLASMYTILRRQGAVCTLDREIIEGLTGLKPRALPYDVSNLN